MTTTDTVLAALGEASRRRILELLHERGESTVSALVDASGMRQPAVSKHLKVLARASLVVARPEGRRRHYRLNPVGLKAGHEWFAGFEEVWQQRFDALDALISEDPSPDSPSTRHDPEEPEAPQEQEQP